MGSAEIRAGRAFVELGVKDKLTSVLRSAQKKLRAFGTSAQAIGKSLTAGGLIAGSPFAMAATVFGGFEDQMLTVKGVTQATTAEYKSMSEEAKRLGRTTSFTASQVASLMAELGRAGFKPDQVNEMTGAVLDLARATATDATLASGIMAASIRQFGLEATDAARVADGLTAAANMSFNSVESLGEALSYAGPVAKDMGMSFEETLAILGGLGNVGIQGSNAGTAIRRLATLTAAEAKSMQKIFGVAFTDAAGNARPLVDVLGDVTAATKNLPSAKRAEKFNQAFGLLGITGASAIGSTAVDIKELQVAIEAAGGVSSRTAKEMDSGLGGAWRIMMSAIEGVAIAVGESLSPVLQRVMGVVERLSGSITAFVSANRLLVVVGGTVAAAMVAAGAGFFALGFAAKAAAVAIQGFMIAMSAVKLAVAATSLIFSPWSIAILGAIAAVSAAVYLFGDQILTLLEPLKRIWNYAVETFRGIANAIQAGEVEVAMQILGVSLQQVWTEVTAWLTEKWVSFANSVIESTANTTRQVIAMWRKTSETLAKWFADLGYKVALWASGEKDYLTDAERTGARDSAIKAYYDDAEKQALDLLTTQKQFDRESFDDRLSQLRKQREELLSQAAIAADTTVEAEKRKTAEKQDWVGSKIDQKAKSATIDTVEYSAEAWKKFNDNNAKIAQAQLDEQRKTREAVENLGGVAVAEA